MGIHGVLIVDKRSGPTSHDVVSQARRLFGTRAVGHAGTLDPMASGVLVLLVGEATKLSSYLTLDDKEYRATIAFGRSTDTLDALGRTVDEATLDDGWLTPDRLAAALAAEGTRQEQVPPDFSAISIDGKRAHRLARSGKPVLLAPRPVAVRRLDLVERSERELICDLQVSKGYYVRALARDLGAALGVPAHLRALERRASGPFRLDEALAWPPDKPPPLLSLRDIAHRSLRPATLTDEGAARARLGQPLSADHFSALPHEAAVVAWLDPAGRLVALGEPDDAGGYRVVRGFTAEAIDSSI